MKEVNVESKRKQSKISLATLVNFIGICAIILGIATVWCIYMM